MASETGSKRSFDNDAPEGWDNATLGDVVKESKRSLDPRDFPKEVFEYYSIPAYQAAERPIQERGSAIGSQKLLVERGTVLFGKLNPRVPKVWRVSGSSPQRKIASTEFIPLEPIDGRIDGEFLYYLSWSDTVMGKAKGLVSGSTPSRQRVDPRSFLALPIPLPPLEEQRAIAEVLRSIQQAKVATEKVIAATREFKRSLMPRLFTYGPVPIEQAKGIELQETDIGPIPSHWRVCSLDNAASSPLKNGIFIKNPRWGTGTRYLNVADVYPNAVLEVGDLRQMEVPNPDVETFSVTAGDLVFVRSSLKRDGVAKACMVPEAGEAVVFDCHLIRLSPDSSVVDPRYLVEYCRSGLGHPRLVGLSKTTTMTTIPQANLGSFHFPLPPLDEQKSMARVFGALDRKIRVERQRVAALDSVFKGLLHDLMMGTRRIAVREVA